jgi:hypothetical protein
MRTHGQHSTLVSPFHRGSIGLAAASGKAQTAVMLARLTAFALAIMILAALRAQFDALPEQAGVVDLAARLWLMAGFFTILTNALIALHLFAVVKGWQIPASRAAGLLLSILVVALIYHLLLARLWSPQGLGWWADQGLHTAVPLGYLGWWLAFAPKTVTKRDLPDWLIWPVGYGSYAMIRGAATGFWPYPFLNADALGWATVSLNLALLLLAFAGLGVALLVVTRWLQPAKPG